MKNTASEVVAIVMIFVLFSLIMWAWITDEKTSVSAETATKDTLVYPTCIKPITVTTYFSDPAQCYGDHTITADGSKIDSSSKRWCAISQDMIPKYGFGDVITIYVGDPLYDGKYVVHDVMNPRVKNCIDILIPPGSGLQGGFWKGKIVSWK